MAERFFGTDGFRGPVDNTNHSARINPETFYLLARVFAGMALEQSDHTPLFIVGSDTRPSSASLREAVCIGIENAGADVWDLSVAPTPTIAWLARTYGASGLSITASHNSAADNGFKPFERGGLKPARATLDELEGRYFRASESPKQDVRRHGKRLARPELADEYLEAVVNAVGGAGVLEGKSVVVDGANGAAYDLGPKLYRTLGAMVVEYACRYVGANINNGCGAAHLEGVRRYIASNSPLANNQEFLGAFASDGDADRVIGLDGRGRTVDGNHWMHQLAAGERGIVGTIYTNSGTRQSVKDMGVEFHECDNGDSHVTARLQELTDEEGDGYTRGGEFTGHIIDTAHLSSGDGLYMGAWLAAKLAAQDASLADVYDALKLWPEKMHGVIVNGANARDLLDRPAITEMIANERELMGSRGRIIVRASGTEPLIRIWAEAADGRALDGAMSRLTSSLQASTTEYA